MDIAANNWTETDGSNTSAAPDGAPEGMAPSGLNDVLRAHQGAVKRWYNWTIPKVTGGISTAYTLSYSVAPGALVDGMTHLVQFHTGNGNAPTLNVNSLGAIPLQYYSAGAWRAVPANLFNGDWICRVAYNIAAGAYRLLMPGAPETGEIKPFAGATAPPGYLLCAGQTVSRTAYAGLFAVLGTTYGAGDGSTTFSLPDLRDRVVAGKDDMGGSSAARFDGTVPRGTLGGAFGGQYNTAITTVSGSATGTVNVSGATSAPISGVGTSTPGPGAAADDNHVHTVTASGSANLPVNASGTSGAFSIVQPTYILNQIIRI